ncbi:MAG: hypothetical protein K2F57_04525 [Candidatus Gastranaerophilales bacterium]|nr:hypothetical protein [Candidatus Gastranaerophilales bacterium]
MKKYIFVQDNKINGCGEVTQIAEGIQNIEVSEDVYNSFMQEPLMYMFSDGKIVENPNYENDKQKVYIQQRLDEILNELEVLDAKRVRAVCEDEVRSERTGETWLDYYNALIYDLRVEYKSLEAQL